MGASGLRYAPMEVELLSASVLDRVPGWHGRPRTAEPLTGGITNRNYRVAVDHEVFVVRIPAESGSSIPIRTGVRPGGILARRKKPLWSAVRGWVARVPAGMVRGAGATVFGAGGPAIMHPPVPTEGGDAQPAGDNGAAADPAANSKTAGTKKPTLRRPGDPAPEEQGWLHCGPPAVAACWRLMRENSTSTTPAMMLHAIEM